MAVLKAINGKCDTKGALKGVIKYIYQPEKTSQSLCLVTGTYMEPVITPELVYRNFLDTQKEWNKESGRMYKHIVISWHPDEKMTGETALAVANEWALQTFPEHTCALAVHTDRDHLHCHIVINTVNNVSGKKLHISKKDLEQMKAASDEICRAYNLSVIQKGKHFDGSDIEEGTIRGYDKKAYRVASNLDEENSLSGIMVKILDVSSYAVSREEFISELEENLVETSWSDSRKYITFTDMDTGIKVRDRNLAKTFTMELSKESLNAAFERNQRLREQHLSVPDPDERGSGRAGDPLHEPEVPEPGTGGEDPELAERKPEIEIRATDTADYWKTDRRDPEGVGFDEEVPATVKQAEQYLGVFLERIGKTAASVRNCIDGITKTIGSVRNRIVGIGKRIAGIRSSIERIRGKMGQAEREEYEDARDASGYGTSARTAALRNSYIPYETRVLAERLEKLRDDMIWREERRLRMAQDYARYHDSFSQRETVKYEKEICELLTSYLDQVGKLSSDQLPRLAAARENCRIMRYGYTIVSDLERAQGTHSTNTQAVLNVEDMLAHGKSRCEEMKKYLYGEEEGEEIKKKESTQPVTRIWHRGRGR